MYAVQLFHKNNLKNTLKAQNYHDINAHDECMQTSHPTVDNICPLQNYVDITRANISVGFCGLATLDAKTCKANSVVSTKLHENTPQYKGYYQHHQFQDKHLLMPFSGSKLHQ